MKTGHAAIDSMVIGDPQWELNMDEIRRRTHISKRDISCALPLHYVDSIHGTPKVSL